MKAPCTLYGPLDAEQEVTISYTGFWNDFHKFQVTSVTVEDELRIFATDDYTDIQLAIAIDMTLEVFQVVITGEILYEVKEIKKGLSHVTRNIVASEIKPYTRNSRPLRTTLTDAVGKTEKLPGELNQQCGKGEPFFSTH